MPSSSYRKRRSRRIAGIKVKYLLWLVLLAACGVAVGGGAYLWKHRLPISQAYADEPKITTPAGETYFGYATDLVDNVRADPTYVPLSGRAMCAWGNPGSSPWQGDNYSALLAANIPVPTAIKLVNQIKTKQAIGQAFASNDQVWADNGLQFSPYMMMTFQNTLCYGTRANFKTRSHVEAGQLFYQDGYFVWVPYVCGNITRLMPLWEAELNRGLLFPPGTFGYGMPAPVIIPGGPKELPQQFWQRPLPVPVPVPEEQLAMRDRWVPGVPWRGQPAPPYHDFYPHAPRKPRTPSVPDVPREVGRAPEPETWALMAAGLIAYMLEQRRRSKRRDSQNLRTGGTAKAEIDS